MGEIRRTQKIIFRKKLKGLKHLEYLGVDGRIVLKLILRNGIELYTRFSWLKIAFNGMVFSVFSKG
jgi:hypothetical protein